MQVSLFAYAQRIVRAEYFFDSDPGFGNATPLSVTAGDSVHIQTSVGLGSLQAGMHRIFVRVMDSVGVWSMYDAQSFYIYPEEVFADPLMAGETFSGIEPPQGNGQAFTFTTADSIDHSFSVSAATTVAGKRAWYVRVKDAANRWSMYEKADVYVYDSISTNSSLSKAEYFFNTDPGPGYAVPVSFSTTDSATFNNLGLSVSGLAQGRHTLFIRFLNTYGQWGLYESSSFFVVEEQQPAPAIIRAEYFFDTLDPGNGNGSSLLLLAGDSIDWSTSLPVNSMDTGWHQLHIRVRDAAGRWSHYESYAFYVCADFPRAAFGFSQFGLTVNFNNNSTGATNYLWKYGNGIQSTQVSPTYSYPSAGSYLVTLLASNGNCPVKDSSIAFVGLSPAFTVSVLNTQVCTHDSLQLSIATTEPFASTNQFYIYLSDSSGNFSNSTLLDVLSARSSMLHAVYIPTFILPGRKYRIRLEATSPNSVSADNGSDISISPVTFSTFTFSGDTVICSGSQLLLQGVTGNNLSYQWFRNNQPFQGATIRDFPAFMDGVYRLQVTNAFGCKNLSNKQVGITLKPAPSTPDITGNTLVGRSALATYQVSPATTGSTYQWTITGGTQIAGGNGNIISVQWDNNPVLGKVEVQETAMNGCSGEVKSLQVSVALSDAHPQITVAGVYPNPFGRELYITPSAALTETMVVQLMDNKGVVVFETSLQTNSIPSVQGVQLPDLPAGMYALLLRSGQYRQTQRLVHY
jgi:PKD repeat protein